MPDLPLGRYVPGDSLLHRLDPRLKLLTLPLLVICSFCVPGFSGLCFLLGLALVLAGCSGASPAFWCKGIWALRWLLLFTLLMHALMSPGRTLSGVAFVSTDGLVHGFRVSAQMTLAVVYSSLLTLTTPPGEIAGAFSTLLRPLERLGLPIRDWAASLMLVLGIIPVLRAEASGVIGARVGAGNAFGRLGLLEKAGVLRSLLGPMVLRLADRADAMAHQVVAGEEIQEMGRVWEPSRKLRAWERMLALAGLVVLWLILKGWT